ncbi:tautomerase family protein [Pseudonocardia sp. RS010]|uniref:tautomerase family protein n=1 Tax=Pseudonocardia sp. RS010 TaxID=3385979 RepID=UPI0039A1B7FA
MPILTFHLVDGRHAPERVRALLRDCCQVYADVLGSSMERVRAFVSLHAPELTFVAGRFADESVGPVGGPGDLSAPFFQFIVLRGRPLEQRQRLLVAFTDLAVEHLGVHRELVRGRAIEVEPVDWAIAGTSAAERRADEIAARAVTGR